MLFHEIYGNYFNALAGILSAAHSETLTAAKISEIVRAQAFGESGLSIPAALREGRWPLLDENNKTPLKNPPALPLTTLERRWLKSLLADPRLALFVAADERKKLAAALADVPPLFAPDTFVYYDRYADGDPYDDPAYRENFAVVLDSLRQNRPLKIHFHTMKEKPVAYIVSPRYLEYSVKDDKFRLITANHPRTVNIGRIEHCYPCDPAADCVPPSVAPSPQKTLVLTLTDERNALERAMLHFSHLAKEVERISDTQYAIRLNYSPDDETELIIRVLSFGPLLKATDPPGFVAKIKERLQRQQEIMKERI